MLEMVQGQRRTRDVADRWPALGLAIVALLLATSSGCSFGEPVDPTGLVPPPPMGVFSVKDRVPNPDATPEDPPPNPYDCFGEQPDDPWDFFDDGECSALGVNGQVLDCYALLSPDSYCGVVFNDPNAPLYWLVDACGQCDPVFYSPPPGIACLGLEPPEPTPPLPESTCKSCHAPNDYDGLNSAENPHPWAGTLDCITCHGGDGAATNPIYAHVCPPPQVGDRQQQILDPRAFFLSHSTSGVQYLPDYTCSTQGGGTKTVRAIEWLNFQNPGDLRSAKEGLGCGLCHGAGAVEAGYKGGNVVANVDRSVMGQAVGLFTGSRHNAGIANDFVDRQSGDNDANTLADLGATEVQNPDFDPTFGVRLVGEVGSLRLAKAVSTGSFVSNPDFTASAVNNGTNEDNLDDTNYPGGIEDDTAAQLYQEILNQACTGCHLQNSFDSNATGRYRSTGCSACHTQVSLLGRSRGDDPNISKHEPCDPNFLTPGERSHNLDHRVRNVAEFPGGGASTFVQSISDTNCLICHNESNRTGLQYQGIRVDENQDLTNANFYPSNNTVVFTNADALFGENQFFDGRNINQFIRTEVWETDVTELIGQAGQDSTPPDLHHVAGMACVDCHTTGATHGRGRIFSRMKNQTHSHDVVCATCHGTIDAYAATDGTHLLTQDGYPLDHTYADGDPAEGDFWLVSKRDGRVHYIPQTRDVVDGVTGKTFPVGASRQGPILNRVASAAMGRADEGGDLLDGTGPEQLHWNEEVTTLPFSHNDGTLGGPGQGLECITCHASWQNNCVGCHLDAMHDNDPASFFFSQVTGERVFFNVNASVRYQNPVDFMMGINDRGKISPYQGLHRFWSYRDKEGSTSAHIATGDRNGLGKDPALLNANRSEQPALGNNPFSPHTVRGRPTQTAVGPRQCLNCHLHNTNETFAHDQDGIEWSGVADYIANTMDYANAVPFNVTMAYGLGSDLWLADADGELVVDSNNPPAYNLDRIVESNGASNSSSSHPLIAPFAANPRYLDPVGTNNVQVVRPLTATVIQRLQQINDIGLTDIYVRNLTPGEDPALTHSYAYDASFKDIGYEGQQ